MVGDGELTQASSQDRQRQGLLTFKAKPDYEKPGDANTDNVYEVTVVATDSHGNRGTMDVKVTVTNEEEAWSGHAVADCSRVLECPVTASLTDPDGEHIRPQMAVVEDRGPRLESVTTANIGNAPSALADDGFIQDATSDSYTPTAAEMPADDGVDA